MGLSGSARSQDPADDTDDQRVVLTVQLPGLVLVRAVTPPAGTSPSAACPVRRASGSMRMGCSDTEVDATPPRLAVTIARAVVVALVTFAVSACRAAPGGTGFANVANLSDAEASFHWQSPGVLGTPVLGGSGTEPIRACKLYARAFDPGDQEITITTSSASKSFTLAAPPSGQTTLWIVIKPGGAIEQTSEAEAPPSPYCGG